MTWVHIVQLGGHHERVLCRSPFATTIRRKFILREILAHEVTSNTLFPPIWMTAKQGPVASDKYRPNHHWRDVHASTY
jgi:hypothetical protein